MKFWKIFSTEFAYLSRRISTLLYLAVLLTFTIVMDQLVTTGDGVYPNNTFHITAITVIGGLIWLVMGASIAGEAASRDVQTRMYSLTYTTPITKLNYLGGRFLAAFTVNSLLILSLPLGTMLSFYLPGMNQEVLLPFRLSAYLNVYFLIALPNAFIATALQFSFSALSRSVMTSYLASLLLAIFPQVIAISASQIFGNWDLIKLLDPVGIAGIVSSELGTWTPTEKNTRLIVLEGMFLWNRILWFGLASGLLLITFRRFSFTSTSTSSWLNRFRWFKKKQTSTSLEIPLIRASAISIPQVQRSFGFKTYFHQALTIAWTSFKKIARHPLGLTLVGVFALVSAIFGDLIMTEFGIALIPTTQKVLTYLAVPVSNINSPWIIMPLLIMYFAGELVWHERDRRISDIADATPVTEWSLFTGKFLGLCLVIFTWMVLLITGGILMQWMLNYDQFQISLYLKTLLGIQLIDYMLFALLALVVHVVVNQKYTGYLVVLIAFIFTAFPSTFKIEHGMLIFGKDPGWWYTDMRGFGDTIGPWLWFKAYWIAWALLLAVGARLLWSRGREQSLKYRVHSAKRRFSGTTINVTLVGAVLLLLTGSFIFYNTNVLNEHLTSSEMIEKQAEYERRYGQYRNTLQPQLSGTKLHVEIYTERQQVDIHATYTLVNKDTVSIDTIHLGSVADIEPGEVKFNRPATVVLVDKELNHQIYKLEQPLRPGDSIQLNFSVHYKQSGFKHNSTNQMVVDNGTYFTNYDILPSIGYQILREIKDPFTRKKHKLSPRPTLPSLYDSVARKRPFSTDHNTFEAVIGTTLDEVAVAPGVLHKTWTKGNRRYFHYQTDAPIRGEYSIMSGNYLVKESKWNDVSISIYYHPKHNLNIEKMLLSVKTSLTYYTEQFGPYLFGHLTIVEQAGSGSGASSEASMIDYGEQYAIMNPDDGPGGFDLPFYIMAHEVAHQWWGGASLIPAYVEGAGVLIEGLAVYSGMQVLEKNYGDSHLQEYVRFMHSFYEMPRSRATPSLLRANETFLYYRKGGLAMHVMSKYLGKEKVNGALRNLLLKHRSGEIPLPTTLDLYKELQDITPDTLNYLLNDMFKENTYWRLKTKQFTAEQTQEGNWQVTLKVQAQKMIVDKTGREIDVPMNDLLEIGIYEQGRDSKDLRDPKDSNDSKNSKESNKSNKSKESNKANEPLYLSMHRIKSGEQTIQVTVRRKPALAGIDPNNLMIDVRTDDNTMQLQEK